MPIESRPIVDREQWKQWRREDVVTASTVGALYNAHPFVSVLKLFVQARGVQFEDRDSSVMRRGRWLEPAVAVAVREQRPDWQLEPGNVYLRDPELRLGGTPDYLIGGDPRGVGVLQAKTTTPDLFVREWVDGAEVPFWIRLQTMTECLLTGAAFGVVAVLTVDPYRMDIHVIELPVDPAMQADIVSRVTRFRDDVAAGREPPPDFAKDAEVIKLLSPHERAGSVRDLSGNNELPVLLAERAEIRERMKRDKAQCEVIETELKYLLGDAERADGLPGWRVTYKTEHHKGYTVDPSDPRVLRILDRREQRT
jgi:predicted phage-related endonuclease